MLERIPTLLRWIDTPTPVYAPPLEVVSAGPGARPDLPIWVRLG
jgi:hypothetical protein